MYHSLWKCTRLIQNLTMVLRKSHSAYGPTMSNSENMLDSLCSVDAYKGVTVDLSLCQQPVELPTFASLLPDLLIRLKAEDMKAAWIKVPISMSYLIPIAAEHGFHYHNAEHNSALLSQWFDKSCESKLPQFATHQVGVAGVVIDELNGKVLAIQDKNRSYSIWKFPGGLADLGEDIEDTAIREIYEETGIQSAFKSALLFRQQHVQPGAWGRSDMYIVCRLAPITYEIKCCQDEVAECRWMTLDELDDEPRNKSPLTRRVVLLLRHGLRHGWDSVDLTRGRLNSIYGGLDYSLFHRPLPVKC